MNRKSQDLWLSFAAAPKVYISLLHLYCCLLSSFMFVSKLPLASLVLSMLKTLELLDHRATKELLPLSRATAMYYNLLSLKNQQKTYLILVSIPGKPINVVKYFLFLLNAEKIKVTKSNLYSAF